MIGEAEIQRLKRRIDSTVPHAARGVIYADAGLLDEAEQELRAHLSLTPTVGQARKLLDTVESWRRPRLQRSVAPTRNRLP